LAVPVEVVQVPLGGYEPDQEAGTTVTVVEALAAPELELALLDTPHWVLYWYWPVPSTMSWMP
jgi:hypothetical protein